MKHKAAELDGALLDAAVAKAEGRLFELRGDPIACYPLLTKEERSWADSDDLAPLRYSTQWKLCGPIINRERISVIREWSAEFWWAAFEVETGNHEKYEHRQYGQTPLIAAMRSYVASKLGDEVDL